MMGVLVTLAAVFAWAVLASGSNEAQCSAFGASQVVISVSTKRNSSGHWNIAVDVNNEAQRLEVNQYNHSGVALTLGQTTSFCNNTDSVRLFASATVSTPTPQVGASPAPQVGASPLGYELMTGLGYYRFSPVAISWLDAEQSCKADGAHLLIINSESEVSVVREFFARAARFKGYTTSSYIHLGFHDRNKDGDYVTVLGKPLASTGYIQWMSGYPTGGTSNNCGFCDANGKMFDYPCSTPYPFICEFGQ